MLVHSRVLQCLNLVRYDDVLQYYPNCARDRLLIRLRRALGLSRTVYNIFLSTL